MTLPSPNCLNRRLLLALEFVVLGLCGVATVATSQSGDGVAVVKYGVASNCPSTVAAQEEIQVVSTAITSPAGRTFANYGLPQAYFTIGTQTITGTVGNASRVCEYSKTTNPGKNNAVMHVYTCSDNAVSVCAVSFTEL